MLLAGYLGSPEVVLKLRQPTALVRGDSLVGAWKFDHKEMCLSLECFVKTTEVKYQKSFTLLE